MDAFVELLSDDPKVCRFAALACVYMGRRLASGEFELECPPERLADFTTCIELINAALTEDRLAGGGQKRVGRRLYRG
jgi:hypothetical protein